MAQLATSLGPKPSLLFFLLFLSLLLIENLFPPQKRQFCFYFSVSLCFSLAFFGLPLFTFSFFSLSLSVLVFLPSFLFLISLSGSCFLFLFVCFLFQDALLFVFVCLFSCFFWITRLFFGIASCFLVVVVVVVVVVLFLLLWYFLFLVTYQRTSLKNWRCQRKQKRNMQTKNGHFDKST